MPPLRITPGDTPELSRPTQRKIALRLRALAPEDAEPLPSCLELALARLQDIVASPAPTPRSTVCAERCLTHMLAGSGWRGWAQRGTGTRGTGRRAIVIAMAIEEGGGKTEPAQ